MLFPAASRFLPRSIPGSGPTSRRNLSAEINSLHSEVNKLTKEHAITARRVAELQRQLDGLERLLREALGELRHSHR
jgi:hypothetical protein